jgi:hypothetical protein
MFFSGLAVGLALAALLVCLKAPARTDDEEFEVDDNFDDPYRDGYERS